MLRIPSAGKLFSVAAVLGVAILVSGLGTTAAQGNPIPLAKIMHGTVVAERAVPAYANALKLSTDMWGDMNCFGPTDNVPVTESTIFRVETASRYFDLSKICGMDGDFRWPRVYQWDNAALHVDTWENWEKLQVGDVVELLLQAQIVRLGVARCQRLGMYDKSYPPASPILNPKAYKKYWAHCSYRVPIMHVRIKWQTTEEGRGSPQTDIHQQTWDFRLVGRGPIAAAKAAPIGATYSKTMRPPW